MGKGDCSCRIRAQPGLSKTITYPKLPMGPQSIDTTDLSSMEMNCNSSESTGPTWRLTPL